MTSSIIDIRYFLNKKNNDIMTSKQQKQNQTILIIDDDPSILMSFKFLLTQSGHTVLARNSGRKGIDIIKKQMNPHA